jgi:tRNA A-37 threonylcarbamoyl transferase component Bud32
MDVYTDIRGLSDLEECKACLKDLHHVGILHCYMNKHNIIIASDGVEFVDFESSRTDQSKLEQEEEAHQLVKALCGRVWPGYASVTPFLVNFRFRLLLS